MILYLHGFNSAPTSHKARAMQGHMAERGLGHLFACPALPHHPREATGLIEAAMQQAGPDTVTLVGSSLGGFYATHFAEKYSCRAVLIQPAVFPHLGLEAMLGPQRNLYTGEEFLLTQEHLDELRALDVAAITRPERYWLFVETGDEVLDYREAVAFYCGALHHVVRGGDHAFGSFPEVVPDLVDWAASA